MVRGTMGKLGVFGLTVIWVSSAVVAGAAAQTYGTVTLAPGFGSQVASGTSGGVVGMQGGQIDASTYGNTPTGPCRGWIAGTPDHTMVLTGAFSNLSVQVTATTAGADTALVVSGPGGTFCNDDNQGLNPGISQAWPPGTYSIWVASYSRDTNHPYTIAFTDLSVPTPPTPPVPVTPPTPPTPVVGLMTASNTPADPLGILTLSTGFLPDPQVRSGTVVGTVDATAIPNLYGGTCRGHVVSNPSHIMNLATSFSYLRVHVRAAADTTLVIQDPNGGFWCNDDTDGFNPVIEGPWNPGLWRIWVGTYSTGTSASYTIEFSEIPRM